MSRGSNSAAVFVLLQVDGVTRRLCSWSSYCSFWGQCPICYILNTLNSIHLNLHKKPRTVCRCLLVFVLWQVTGRWLWSSSQRCAALRGQCPKCIISIVLNTIHLNLHGKSLSVSLRIPRLPSGGSDWAQSLVVCTLIANGMIKCLTARENEWERVVTLYVSLLITSSMRLYSY